MLNNLSAVFESLKKNNVRYVVIGGIASVLHGVPRATFDLDILIDPTVENVKALLRSFLEAGLGTADLTTPAEVLANEITVFKDVVRIDVQTRTPGLLFSEAWEHKETRNLNQVAFYIVCKPDLIASKLAAGRKVDLEDVRLLQLPPQT